MLSMSTLSRRQRAVNTDGADADADAGAPGGEGLSELVALVFRLDGLLKAAGDALAEPAGQTTARWRVLGSLVNGPMTVAQIAADWWLARQSVQRVADLLEHDGLVAYGENPAHRRAYLVRLTPSGWAALHRVRAAQREWANTVAGRIATQDLQAANDILSRVIEALPTVEDRRLARRRPARSSAGRPPVRRREDGAPGDPQQQLGGRVDIEPAPGEQLIEGQERGDERERVRRALDR